MLQPSLQKVRRREMSLSEYGALVKIVALVALPLAFAVINIGGRAQIASLNKQIQHQRIISENAEKLALSVEVTRAKELSAARMRTVATVAHMQRANRQPMVVLP